MALPVLWHFTVSHFNEKVRWALDFKRIPHIRRALFFSYLPRTLWATGQPALPVLVLDGKAIADSTRIMEALERLQPEPRSSTRSSSHRSIRTPGRRRRRPGSPGTAPCSLPAPRSNGSPRYTGATAGRPRRWLRNALVDNAFRITHFPAHDRPGHLDHARVAVDIHRPLPRPAAKATSHWRIFPMGNRTGWIRGRRRSAPNRTARHPYSQATLITTGGSRAMSDQTWSQTTCILCYVNCGLEVATEGRKITRVRGDRANARSQGYLCQKPQQLQWYGDHADRLTTPLRRRPDGTHEPISWETAFTEIAARLNALRAEHGGEAFAFYGGGGQGNHLGGAYFSALRGALGATKYFNPLSQEKTGDFWVNGRLYGDQRCHTAEDIEHTDLLVVLGCNPWQANGFQGARNRVNQI